MSVGSRYEGVELKIASSQEERQSAFELIYESYFSAGLCDKKQSGMLLSPHHLLKSTNIFIAILNGGILNTLSLVIDDLLGLPMEDDYPEVVNKYRKEGLKLAEITCLADRCNGSKWFFHLFCELCRLMAQYARKELVDQLMIAVHPRHAPVYKKVMGFKQVGEERKYSLVRGKPAVALCRNMHTLKEENMVIWERFFGYQLPEKELQSQPISESEKDYFLKKNG